MDILTPSTTKPFRVFFLITTSDFLEIERSLCLIAEILCFGNISAYATHIAETIQIYCLASQ
jgi:hypothetical protein